MKPKMVIKLFDTEEADDDDKSSQSSASESECQVYVQEIQDV